MTRLLTIALYAVALTALSIDPAHAYLNADSASFIVQGLLGGVAGFAVVVRYVWSSFLGRLRTPLKSGI